MAYAAQTTVSVEKTKVEIETTLEKYGATGFMSGFMNDTAFIQFLVHNRYVRFKMTIPKEAEFAHGPKGRRRAEWQKKEAFEQTKRQKWRALLLVIKAKLESVEAGVATFEEEFMAHILLPNSKTVGEFMGPQIKAAYDSGQMPMMLPGLGETHREDDDVVEGIDS
jgi:hypothetical protein